MSRYLLDTDWVVGILNGQEKAIHTVLELAPAGLAISIITYGELYEGAAFAHDPQPALSGLRSFLKGFSVDPSPQALPAKLTQSPPACFSSPACCKAVLGLHYKRQEQKKTGQLAIF